MEQQRGSKILDADLGWYYADRDGDLGRRGVALEPSVRGDAEHGPTPRQLAAAGRVKRIEAALHTLSHADQRVLRLAHESLPPGRRAGLAALGDLAAVVVAQTDPAELATMLHRSRSRRSGLAAERAEAAFWLTTARLKAVQDVIGALERFRAERAAAGRREALAKQSRIDARTRDWMGSMWERENERVFGSAS